MKTQQNTSVKWKWLTVAALVAGTASVVATAGPRNGGNHARHGGGIATAFERYDANRDGNVSRAEFDAVVAERQSGMDGNGDGVVTFEEADAFREFKREERARARFARLDQNADGIVSIEEAASRQDRMFTFLDRNDDGIVARDELPQRHRKGG